MFQIHSRNKTASASWARASRPEHAGAQTLGLLTFPGSERSCAPRRPDASDVVVAASQQQRATNVWAHPRALARGTLLE